MLADAPDVGKPTDGHLLLTALNQMPGQRKSIENTVRYLGVDMDEALTLLDKAEISTFADFSALPGSRCEIMKQRQRIGARFSAWKVRYVGDYRRAEEAQWIDGSALRSLPLP